MISINHITKVYNPKTTAVKAVDDVSLNIESGEFTAIVGASGSGKTTLLNIIGGIDEPTLGDVIINGNSITTLGEKERTAFRRENIGFIFQDYNLLPILTALENVTFIMEMQGKSKKEREERAKELLEKIGLGDKLNSRPNELSGGQQQRVAVARALAHHPKFVIADEPTANLDSQSTENLLDIMRVLNEEEKVTFLFSTHDQRVVDKAKRVIVFEDGKVKSDSKI